MAYSVEMPELGESVTEGTITQWLKSVGDTVEADEPLLEVSTDKVDTEIPSPVSGTLLEIKAEEDDTIDVGAVIAIIGEEGESTGSSDAPAKEEAPAEEPAAEADPADQGCTGQGSCRFQQYFQDRKHIRKLLFFGRYRKQRRKRHRQCHCQLRLPVCGKSLCMGRNQPDKRSGLLRLYHVRICTFRNFSSSQLRRAGSGRQECFLFGSTAG